MLAHTTTYPVSGTVTACDLPVDDGDDTDDTDGSNDVDDTDNGNDGDSADDGDSENEIVDETELSESIEGTVDLIENTESGNVIPSSRC
ncbi:hypothetical protein [Natrinema salifodinae]|uniref:Uncharacterized protein n=1 Tax=Natrinema salifodinae TaxID=1202768 RepID=A0A1I0LZ89_9EURY|nr:hypothetical protein [Natrinema salifodinae]SEV81253.1 hypothetical protein SAMN05216285_0207 [Natrinema salifodinae]